MHLQRFASCLQASVYRIGIQKVNGHLPSPGHLHITSKGRIPTRKWRHRYIEVKLLELWWEMDETYKYPIFSFKPYSKLLPSPSTAPHVVDTGAMSCCFCCCSYRPGFFIPSTLEDASGKHISTHKHLISLLTACVAKLHPHHWWIAYPGTVVDSSAEFSAQWERAPPRRI